MTIANKHFSRLSKGEKSLDFVIDLKSINLLLYHARFYAAGGHYSSSWYKYAYKYKYILMI